MSNYLIEQIRDSNSLQHHGIKGMHWGIRRYRNSDGSYTAEGRARYIHDKSAKSSSYAKGYQNEYKSAVKNKVAKEYRAQAKAESDYYNNYHVKGDKAAAANKWNWKTGNRVAKDGMAMVYPRGLNSNPWNHIAAHEFNKNGIVSKKTFDSMRDEYGVPDESAKADAIKLIYSNGNGPGFSNQLNSRGWNEANKFHDSFHKTTKDEAETWRLIDKYIVKEEKPSEHKTWDPQAGDIHPYIKERKKF